MTARERRALKDLRAREKAAPKERAMMFSGESVRLILEGRKTQTRRIIRPRPLLVGDLMSFLRLPPYPTPR